MDKIRFLLHKGTILRYVKYMMTILMLTMVLYACNGKNATGSDNGDTGNGDTGNGDTGSDSGNGDTGNDPNLTSATFTAVQQEVFTPTCAISGCHNGSQAPNLSVGVAFNNIVDVQSSQGLDYIEPGNPDISYLVQKLEGTGIAGLRMPRGGTALSVAAIDSIKAWVTDGAPNN